jgi:hypothetical protein
MVQSESAPQELSNEWSLKKNKKKKKPYILTIENWKNFGAISVYCPSVLELHTQQINFPATHVGRS